jgi:predicted RecA/RadA family phage recombinase
MKNYIQPGKTVTLPAPAATASGDVVTIGSLTGIAAGDAATGEPLDLTLEGVFDLPKVAANDFAVGAPVYWNSGSALATTTASGNARIGTAVAAAAASTAAVPVRLVQL